MYIHISKENIAYIDKLILAGYKEVQPKIKGLITLSDIEQIEVCPYKKIYTTRVECTYCNKLFHRNSLSTHIRRKHK
jgi:hypothetical protein